MKVFVAGATGVVGLRAVPALVAAGHEVIAIARTPAKAEALRAAGATPAHVDLFDADAVARAAEGAGAVINLATHIPPVAKAWRTSAWAENDRIRREGSAALASAAAAVGAEVFVQEAITFPYAEGGDRWLDESAPRDVVPGVASVDDAEASAARFTEGGGRGVVLRFAQFYAPDAGHTLDMVRVARLGLFAQPGRRDGFWSYIHAVDAGAAVVAAIRAPGGAWNIADDEPLTRADVAAALAAALGKRRLRVVPAWAVRAAGSAAVSLTRSHRISNAAFKQATGWAPTVPSVRVGFRGLGA